MKIAINKCFGGFSLSPLAIKRIAELKGKECYFYKGGGLNEPYRLISIEEATERAMFSLAYTIGNEEELNNILDTSIKPRTREENKVCNKKYKEINLNYNSLERNDLILIQVIEELGKLASTKYSQIEIVDIPDDVKWTIEEYDGLEHIAERHRTWE